MLLVAGVPQHMPCQAGVRLPMRLLEVAEHRHGSRMLAPGLLPMVVARLLMEAPDQVDRPRMEALRATVEPQATVEVVFGAVPEA